ncbi:MAG: hypothetical protein ACI8X5_002541 [Planctomycetota bacterium]
MYLVKVNLWMMRWILLSPLGWLWIVVSLSAIPLLDVLTPGSTLGHGQSLTNLFSQLTFLAGIGGAMLAVSALHSNRWVLTRCGTVKRLFSQGSAVTLASITGASFVAAGSLWGIQESPIDSPVIGAIGISSLHLAAMAILLLQLPRLIRYPAVLLPAIAWLLPALLSPTGAIGKILILALDARCDPNLLRDPSLALLQGTAAPIISLTIGAILLTSGKQDARPIQQ